MYDTELVHKNQGNKKNRNQELDRHESQSHLYSQKIMKPRQLYRFAAYTSSQLTLFLSGRKVRAVRTMTASVFHLVLLEKGKIDRKRCMYIV
jgi:hypothetical protein